MGRLFYFYEVVEETFRNTLSKELWHPLNKQQKPSITPTETYPQSNNNLRTRTPDAVFRRQR
jgi:hypothetical protein